MNDKSNTITQSTIFTPIKSIQESQLLSAELLETAFEEFGLTVFSTQMNEAGDKLVIVIVESGPIIDLRVIEAVANQYPPETLKAQENTNKNLPIGMAVAILDMSQVFWVSIKDLLYNYNTAKLVSDLDIAGYEICLFGKNPISRLLRLSTQNTISRRKEPYVKLSVKTLLESFKNPGIKSKLIQELKPFVKEAKFRNENPKKVGSNGKILINVSNSERKSLHIALFRLIMLLNSAEVNII